jgi:hypothetical protein
MKNESPAAYKSCWGLVIRAEHPDYFHIIHRYVMFSYVIYWAGLSGMTSQLMR